MPAPAAGLPRRLLLNAGFDEGRIRPLRRRIGALARCYGLARDRADDLVLAVSELMTNAVRHGGGSGEARVWLDEDLICEVHDRGGGFDVGPHAARTEAPRPSPSGGSGLWIVRQVADAVSIVSGPTGTTARIRFAAPRAGPGGWLGAGRSPIVGRHVDG